MRTTTPRPKYPAFRVMPRPVTGQRLNVHIHDAVVPCTVIKVRPAGTIDVEDDNGRYWRVTGLAFLALLLTAVVSTSAHASQCSDGNVFNPYGGHTCPTPTEPVPDPVPTTPTCPQGTVYNPYLPSGAPCEPFQPPASPDPEPTPTNPPAPVAPLYRAIPATSEAFATLVEQGPSAPIETHGLTGPIPAFIWYAPFSGAFWLIVDGVYGPDRICVGDLEPNLNLTSMDLDDDGQEDLLGHHVPTGKVYRYYTRNLSQCQ
jgi:hypothetical protein